MPRVVLEVYVPLLCKLVKLKDLYQYGNTLRCVLYVAASG